MDMARGKAALFCVHRSRSVLQQTARWETSRGYFNLQAHGIACEVRRRVEGPRRFPPYEGQELAWLDVLGHGLRLPVHRADTISTISGGVGNIWGAWRFTRTRDTACNRGHSHRKLGAPCHLTFAARKKPMFHCYLHERQRIRSCLTFQ